MQTEIVLFTFKAICDDEPERRYDVCNVDGEVRIINNNISFQHCSKLLIKRCTAGLRFKVTETDPEILEKINQLRMALEV